MASNNIREQHIAVFGESGSGKTVLLSSFFGATQEPAFLDKSLFRLIADNTGQGTRLRQNYLKMKNAAQAPAKSRFAATRYAFTLKPNGGDSRAAAAQPFSALRLVWHDYPGEWFEEDPSSEEEATRRVETFTELMTSDVALLLVDGQKLIDHVGEEEKYLKSLLWGMRDGLERLKDEILPDGKPLKGFPRIWVIALTKADLLPDMDAHGFHDLMIEKAAGDLDALLTTLKGFVEVPEAMSLGEDFMLLSSAKFEPGGKIEVTERKGVDLLLPVACMLPLERVAQWADRFDIPLSVLARFADNSEEFATIITTVVAPLAARVISKVPRIGPWAAGLVIPALSALVTYTSEQLEEAYRKARDDKDYLTATLTKFRIDLDEGVKEKLFVKSLW